MKIQRRIFAILSKSLFYLEHKTYTENNFYACLTFYTHKVNFFKKIPNLEPF
jgi:hypothetical protein